jgi:hypothetical protein
MFFAATFRLFQAITLNVRLLRCGLFCRAHQARFGARGCCLMLRSNGEPPKSAAERIFGRLITRV